jgi:hypothetical protein
MDRIAYTSDEEADRAAYIIDHDAINDHNDLLEDVDWKIRHEIIETNRGVYPNKSY